MAKSTTTAAQKPGKALAKAQIIMSGADIALSVATSIAGVRDERQRVNFQQNLQLLSNDQQVALAKALNNANSQEERLKILGLSLTDMTNQRINNLQEIIAQQEKNRRSKLISNAIQVGALIIVGGIVIYFVAKKD
jgi:hypothetical protein